MAEHEDLLRRAMEVEARAQRAALAGDADAAESAFADAAVLYRRSWEAAPPRAFGRLIGHLKAAVQAGAGESEADYVARELPEPDSAPSWYAVALAALVAGDDQRAARAAREMRAGAPSDAFHRAAGAIAALAERDAAAYGDAVRDIVADFEGRDEHLTGVAYADTAQMLELLADRRGMREGVSSALLPPAPPARA